MKDSFILQKCIPDINFDGIPGNQSTMIALLYERYYPYWDPTAIIDDLTWNFSDFPSSPLIEMFKRHTLMEYFIKEYFINDDIYTDREIKKNKCFLMTFFIKVNNLFRRLYLVDNQSEFTELFLKIEDVIIDFADEIIPPDKLMDIDLPPETYDETLPEWPIQESLIFLHLMIGIVNHYFHTSIRDKYGIFSIIQENIKSNWESIDENKIRHEIETMLLR